MLCGLDFDWIKSYFDWIIVLMIGDGWFGFAWIFFILMSFFNAAEVGQQKVENVSGGGGGGSSEVLVKSLKGNMLIEPCQVMSSENATQRRLTYKMAEKQKLI